MKLALPIIVLILVPIFLSSILFFLFLSVVPHDFLTNKKAERHFYAQQTSWEEELFCLVNCQ